MSSAPDQSPIFTEAELYQLTGYHQPARQLEVLHDRGFLRAYRNRLGNVVLERPHYDAVTRGEQVAAKPKVRLLRAA